MIITPIHEYNHCHSPADGKFCGGSSAGIQMAGADDLNQRLQAVETQLAGGKTGAAAVEAVAVALKQQAVRVIADAIVGHPDLRRVVVEPLSSDRERAEFLANTLLKAWAESSVEGRAMQAVQLAAQDLFGLSEASTQHLKGDRSLYDVSPSLFQAAVRAQYDATQAWFKAQGITEVTIYRGTAVEVDVPLGTTQPVTLTMQPISSFTVDLKTAARFGNIHADRPYWAKGRQPILVASRVPVNRVLSTALTGFGAAAERELTVLGGTLDGVGYRPTTMYFDSMVRDSLTKFTAGRT